MSKADLSRGPGRLGSHLAAEKTASNMTWTSEFQHLQVLICLGIACCSAVFQVELCFFLGFNASIRLNDLLLTCHLSQCYFSRHGFIFNGWASLGQFPVSLSTYHLSPSFRVTCTAKSTSTCSKFFFLGFEAKVSQHFSAFNLFTSKDFIHSSPFFEGSKSADLRLSGRGGEAFLASPSPTPAARRVPTAQGARGQCLGSKQDGILGRQKSGDTWHKKPTELGHPTYFLEV